MGFKDLFKKKNVTEPDIDVTEDKIQEDEKEAAEETEQRTKEVAEETEEKQAEQEQRKPEEVQTEPQAPVKQISEERRKEIGPIVFKTEIEEGDLEPLSIQETIYLLVSVDHFNEESEAGIENYEQKCKILDKVLARKLASAEVLYMTFDVGTNLPYITQGCVEVYSELEYAEEAVKHYGEQYRSVQICEIRKDDSRFPDKMSAFEFLYYLGMEHLLVDNGRFKTVVNRQDVLKIKNANPELDVKKPIRNPKFRYALIEFFQEVKWPVSYEKRDEVVKEKEDRMIEELKKAKFLVPMLFEGEEARGIEKQIAPKPGKNMILPKVETQDHIAFTPLFTDWTEFVKIYPKDKWNGLVITFDEAITLTKDNGIVINPMGENLIMNQQSFEALKNRED